jgi:hypothetical protein
MSVLYLVVPYARMDCYLLNLLAVRGKCGQSNQSCDHGEWRSNPTVHQNPLPFAPLGSFLLYSLCLRCFWHLLPLARPVSRLSRMPEISSTTPSQRFTKTSKKQSLASSTILKSSVYFLLPAFTTISAIHAIVDMLSVTSRPHFGCYSSVRTGSAGQVSGGKVASGGKATSGSKAGRMHNQTSSSP